MLQATGGHGLGRGRRVHTAAWFAAFAVASFSVAALTLLTASPAARAADKPPHVVQDPHYGDVLFYFYQQRYFTALTQLMVSQQFDRMPHHTDEAEILRGGMFLSFGLHREAGEIFARLIDKEAPPAVRDRAWFYLAKIRYQRGLLPEAEDAIGRIAGALPPDLNEERALLQANLLMARADYPAAARVLSELKLREGAARYVRFNLGVALIKSGDTEAGTKLLDEIGKGPAATEETRSLRDRANVALGFSAIQADDPGRARFYLERVRLAGMLANKALLGFGWAAVALKDHKSAIVPWTELAQRDTSDPAVLEARLALPYAYGQVGAFAQSLELYTDAIKNFEREDQALDESIAAIRAGKLIDRLIARNPGTELGWFWAIDQLPEMPHAAHLTPLLASHEFQEAFKNYRDLQLLAQNLLDWDEKLRIYNDMLANRRLAFAQRLPLTQAQERALGIDALTARRGALTEELGAAERRADGAAFADARERALAERLARVQAALEKAGDDPEIAALRERQRRVAGALTWQLAQQYPARSWNAKKGLREIDAGIVTARERDAALVRAQQSEPARFDGFSARISELDGRLRAMEPQVIQLAREQQQAIQELAVVQLQRQKERLAAYAIQARYAVAQIYDRARSDKDGDDASPK